MDHNFVFLYWLDNDVSWLLAFNFQYILTMVSALFQLYAKFEHLKKVQAEEKKKLQQQQNVLVSPRAYSLHAEYI